jgi:DNA-binding NarL/FixJ family response regulator
MDKQTLQILLIEDNPGDVRLIQELLKGTSGFSFELHSVNRLSAGMDYLAKTGADIIMLDLSLPDSRGYDTFVKIIACAPQTPIVILTGLEDDALAIKAVRAGAQDYLVKGQAGGNLLVRTLRYATERKQAEKEMRLMINDLRNLSDVEKKNRIFAEALAQGVASLRSTLNSDEILDSIIDNLNKVVPADAVSIMLIHDHQGKIVREKGYKERGLDGWVKQKQFNIDEYPLFNEVIRSGKYEITPNTDKNKDWIGHAETAWIKSNIIAPILEDKKVIGFVNVDSTTLDFYTEEHAQRLEAFTDQVSSALKNAQMYETIQRRSNRMSAMTQIDQAINSSLDMNITFELVLSSAIDQLGADAA